MPFLCWYRSILFGQWGFGANEEQVTYCFILHSPSPFNSITGIIAPLLLDSCCVHCSPSPLYPAVSTVSYPTPHRVWLSCYMELQGQASLWLQLQLDMKLANHWRYWTTTELIIHTISPSWQLNPIIHQLPTICKLFYPLTLKRTLWFDNGKPYPFLVTQQIPWLRAFRIPLLAGRD